jgi:hypothetical protein
MGRVDDAIRTLEETEDGMERALQLAGLISTLFKIKGVVLVVTGQMAFNGYANAESDQPNLELAAFAGKLAPRTILEIMRGQLYATGSLFHWTVAGIPVRFQQDAGILCPELCRDFTTDHGVIKLVPVEEITANYILAAVYPEPDAEAHTRAHQLLFNGLTDAFQMNWTMLHSLCHLPDYRVGEELAQMRLAAKKDVDAQGLARDHIGETSVLPKVEPPPREDAPSPSPTATEEAIDEAVIDAPGMMDALPNN